MVAVPPTDRRNTGRKPDRPLVRGEDEGVLQAQVADVPPDGRGDGDVLRRDAEVLQHAGVVDVDHKRPLDAGREGSCDHPGADRLTRGKPPVLAGVAEIRDHQGVP